MTTRHEPTIQDGPSAFLASWRAGDLFLLADSAGKSWDFTSPRAGWDLTRSRQSFSGVLEGGKEDSVLVVCGGRPL